MNILKRILRICILGPIFVPIIPTMIFFAWITGMDNPNIGITALDLIWHGVH